MKIQLFSREFWGLVVMSLCIVALSTAIQSLMIWFGEAIGVSIDTKMMFCLAVGAILLVPAILCIGMGTEFKSINCLLITIYALIGIQVSVVKWFGLFFWVDMIVLLLCLWYLYRIATERFLISLGVSFFLPCAVGTYFAMVINGIKPPIDLWCISLLLSLAVGVWFVPAKEEIETEV